MGEGEDCAAVGLDCTYHVSTTFTGEQWFDTGCKEGDHDYVPRASLCQLRPLKAGECTLPPDPPPPPAGTAQATCSDVAQAPPLEDDVQRKISPSGKDDYLACWCVRARAIPL